jgi:D-alanyl-D-alanine endopeptidase (penicillin-binding protein 7)
VHKKLFRSAAIFAVVLMSATGVFSSAEAEGATGARAGVKSRTKAKTKVSARKTTVSAKKKRPSRYSSSRLSRARRARARRAAAARALWLEAQTPRFKTDESGELVPDIRAAAAIIYNPETGQVLWEENSNNQRSIASITKVMTAAVVLEDSPDLTQSVTIDRADVYRANHTYLRASEKVTLEDLLHLTLIASDNAAARALARSWPEGYDAFIERMNEKAQELGLTNTQYADPSGLNADNMSSAYDMARLITFAAGDERIASIMRKPYYVAHTNRRAINIHSTNQLVMKGDVDVRGGKTGFISKAGYCLATLLRLPQTNQQVAVVVLGAQSNAGRFMETRHLFNWLSSKAGDLLSTAAKAAGSATPVAATALP